MSLSPPSLFPALAIASDIAIAIALALALAIDIAVAIAIAIAIALTLALTRAAGVARSARGSRQPHVRQRCQVRGARRWPVPRRYTRTLCSVHSEPCALLLHPLRYPCPLPLPTGRDFLSMRTASAWERRRVPPPASAWKRRRTPPPPSHTPAHTPLHITLHAPSPNPLSLLSTCPQGGISSGLPNADGICVEADGTRYEGEWLSGFRHGEARG